MSGVSTLVDHSAADLLTQAEGLGVAVVNAATYGGGILAKPAGGSTTYGYRPASAETLASIAAMDEAARDAGTDLATAALQASVRDPRINATVVGMSEPAGLDGVVAALDEDLPPEFLDHLAGPCRPLRTGWTSDRS